MTCARPLVSVIMPCHNAAPYVAEAVASVFAQTHRPVQLIVADDGSTDGSGGIVEELARQHVSNMILIHTDHIGPYPARNAALRRATGEFISFLDADDWWDATALEKLHAAMAASGADIAYCGWQNVGEQVHAEPYVPPEYEKADPVERFLSSCPWPIHGALVRRSLLDRLGGFSERRYASMDYDFWLRAIGLTRRIVRVPEVLAFYRWHGAGQVSAVKWRQVLDALAAQQDFIREHRDLVAHIPAARLRDLTDGQVLRQAYRAFWKRDLESAHKLFRHAAAARAFSFADLSHILPASLPMPLYRRLVAVIDRKAAR
ncbi:MAG: hypothetical protein Fur0039_21980 [Rhodocyclaceae bacterium]